MPEWSESDRPLKGLCDKFVMIYHNFFQASESDRPLKGLCDFTMKVYLPFSQYV